MATCSEFMRQINDPRSIVNCGSCATFNREIGRCRDEIAVVKRYEDSASFTVFDRMMRDAKDIRLEA